ncbi:MAG TPA: hypothetical protein PKE16_19895, partial [Hyphomicrobium sp.]|nr:hypothetical protein [Hyphomicrobium sp.]
MFPQFHWRRSAPAIVLAATVTLAFVCPSHARGKDPFSACDAEAGLAVLSSPMAPWKGAPL